MDRALPIVDVPPVGLAERRRTVRFPVVRPIIGRAFPVDRPVTLHSIGATGFSALVEIRLTLGADYDFEFVIHPYTVVVSARLVHALRICGDQTANYLLGFEFIEANRDQAGITALIARATRIPRAPIGSATTVG